jgi:hypothetical protein
MIHRRPTQTNEAMLQSHMEFVKNDDGMLLSWTLISGVQFRRLQLKTPQTSCTGKRSYCDTEDETWGRDALIGDGIKFVVCLLI